VVAARRHVVPCGMASTEVRCARPVEPLSASMVKRDLATERQVVERSHGRSVGDDARRPAGESTSVSPRVFSRGAAHTPKQVQSKASGLWLKSARAERDHGLADGSSTLTLGQAHCTRAIAVWLRNLGIDVLDALVHIHSNVVAGRRLTTLSWPGLSGRPAVMKSSR